MCAVYIFPLVLYRLSVLPLPKSPRSALKRSHSKMLWGGRRLMVRWRICCQRLRNGSLGMPNLENHWFSERMAYLDRSLSKDTVGGRKVKDFFPCLKSDSIVEGRRRLRGEAQFVRECREALSNLPESSDFSQRRKELYRELVAGSASDPLLERLG